MKPQSLRPICRSRNPFSPSIALWQHFVLPYNQLRQLRPSSSATESSSPLTPGADPIVESDAPDTPNSDASFTPGPIPFRRWRRVVDNQKVNKFDTPAAASAYKNSKSRVEKSRDSSNASLQEAQDAFNSSSDYQGRVVDTLAASRPHPEDKLPWSVPIAEAASGVDRLSLEIARFYEYAKPSRIEALARRKVIEQVRRDVSEVFPDKVLEVFGSERTGLALATSDIDLRLMSNHQEDRPSPMLPPVRKERGDLLNSLFLLRNLKFGRNKMYLMSAVRFARYPLLAVQHQPSGLDIQIVCSNDTSLSRSLMQQYMQEYPYLRQVYFVVKTMFDERGLSDVFRGGIGSYSLFMMLVASIRHSPHRRNDAAGALINFLRFWAEFDTTTQGVSIEPPVLFDKYKESVMPGAVKAKLETGYNPRALPPYMLCLRDPADETNDLGRKGLCIKHVQETFKHLAHKLKLDTKHNNRASLLKPLVGNTYALRMGRRRKLAEYGTRTMQEMQSDIAEKARAIRAAEAEQEGGEKAVG